MKPTRCPASHGDRLTDIDMRGEFWIAPFRIAKARHVACLDCGVVTGHIDDATIAKLRARGGIPTKAKAGVDEL